MLKKHAVTMNFVVSGALASCNEINEASSEHEDLCWQVGRIHGTNILILTKFLKFWNDRVVGPLLLTFYNQRVFMSIVIADS